MTHETDKVFPGHPALEKRTDLTKLELFSLGAMQGLCANHEFAKTIDIDDWDEYKDRLASASLDIARSTLKALNEAEKEVEDGN